LVKISVGELGGVESAETREVKVIRWWCLFPENKLLKECLRMQKVWNFWVELLRFMVHSVGSYLG